MTDETPDIGPHETRSLTTLASSPLPAWLVSSTPMAQRYQALADAMRPAHPQTRANILGLLATRYPVSAAIDAATVEAQSRLLSDDLDDLPESVLREACREAARTCKFMPLAAEIVAFAKPHMDKLRDAKRHLDSLAPRYAPPPEPKREYVDPRSVGDALKFMREAFAEADAKEGVASRTVDYAQGTIVPNMPAHTDASDELRAFAARRMG